VVEGGAWTESRLGRKPKFAAYNLFSGLWRFLGVVQTLVLRTVNLIRYQLDDYA
jgi:hypothetical protein